MDCNIEQYPHCTVCLSVSETDWKMGEREVVGTYSVVYCTALCFRVGKLQISEIASIDKTTLRLDIV